MFEVDHQRIGFHLAEVGVDGRAELESRRRLPEQVDPGPVFGAALNEVVVAGEVGPVVEQRGAVLRDLDAGKRRDEAAALD